MSWSSIVIKKPEIKQDINKEENIQKPTENIIVDEDTCIENFEIKYNLDLFDFCFDLKDDITKSNDLLLNIDSFKIENFIKEHIDYRDYGDIKVESDEDKYKEF